MNLGLALVARAGFVLFLALIYGLTLALFWWIWRE